jgi:2-(1,2-epoxy-1,2-dihydrophenyl)acetyl-CoA isomerase
LTDEMDRGLLRIFQDLHERSDVRAVILTGSGSGFCAGSDIGGMLKATGAAARRRLQRRHATIQAIAQLEKPVVAIVRGPVAGIGFSLVAACDLVVASETTYFQQAFRGVGLVPDGGAIHFLNQRLGISRAKDLVMTGRKLTAREAFEWGLVNRLVPDDQLDSEGMLLAQELADGPTYVIGLTKKMFASTYSPSLDVALEIESYAASVARSSKDHREGVTAFREKRKPRFTGE